MDIIQDVEQFFKNFWTNTVKPDVQKAEEVVEVFFESAETAVESELGVEGLKIVTDAVSAAETAGGTGLQKLAAAQSAIATDLSAANLANVAQNTINVAIEGAVSQLKAGQTQSASQQQTGTDASSGTGNTGADASVGTSGGSTGTAS